MYNYNMLLYPLPLQQQGGTCTGRRVCKTPQPQQGFVANQLQGHDEEKWEYHLQIPTVLVLVYDCPIFNHQSNLHYPHTMQATKNTVEFPALNSSSNPDVSVESIPSSDGSPTSICTAGAAGLLLLRFFGWRLCHRGRRKRPCGRLGLLALIVPISRCSMQLDDPAWAAWPSTSNFTNSVLEMAFLISSDLKQENLAESLMFHTFEKHPFLGEELSFKVLIWKPNSEGPDFCLWQGPFPATVPRAASSS